MSGVTADVSAPRPATYYFARVLIPAFLVLALLNFSQGGFVLLATWGFQLCVFVIVEGLLRVFAPRPAEDTGISACLWTAIAPWAAPLHAVVLVTTIIALRVAASARTRWIIATASGVALIGVIPIPDLATSYETRSIVTFALSCASTSALLFVYASRQRAERMKAAETHGVEP